jgi:hypothetical protein
MLKCVLNVIKYVKVIPNLEFSKLNRQNLETGEL